jgi:hypothetical protein
VTSFRSAVADMRGSPFVRLSVTWAHAKHGAGPRHDQSWYRVLGAG